MCGERFGWIEKRCHPAFLVMRGCKSLYTKPNLTTEKEEHWSKSLTRRMRRGGKGIATSCTTSATKPAA